VATLGIPGSRYRAPATLLAMRSSSPIATAGSQDRAFQLATESESLIVGLPRLVGQRPLRIHRAASKPTPFNSRNRKPKAPGTQPWQNMQRDRNSRPEFQGHVHNKPRSQQHGPTDPVAVIPGRYQDIEMLVWNVLIRPQSFNSLAMLAVRWIRKHINGCVCLFKGFSPNLDAIMRVIRDEAQVVVYGGSQGAHSIWP